MKMGQTTTWIVIAVVAVLVIGGFYYFSSGSAPASGVSSQSETSTTGNEQQQSQAPESANVPGSISIKYPAFFPGDKTIHVGDTVTWNNDDSISHTIVSDQPEFASRPLKPGESFTFTFDKAGTYPYHCGIHPMMKGTIIVK